MYAQIDAKAVGRRIYSFRRKARLTQEKLAEEIGMTAEFVGNIERGVSTPSVRTLFRISLALHITMNDLIDESVAIWTDDDTPCKLRAPQTIYCNTISDWLNLFEPIDDDCRAADPQDFTLIRFRRVGDDDPPEDEDTDAEQS